jgi:hypothetical protein
VVPVHVGEQPADACGVCGDSVSDPVGYPLGLWELQYLAKRFGALPEGDLRITMCNSCYTDLDSIVTGPDHVPRDEAEENFSRITPVLDEIPADALYMESYTVY